MSHTPALSKGLMDSPINERKLNLKTDDFMSSASPKYEFESTLRSFGQTSYLDRRAKNNFSINKNHKIKETSDLKEFIKPQPIKNSHETWATIKK